MAFPAKLQQKRDFMKLYHQGQRGQILYTQILILKQRTYLCNRPECEHCDDTCTSWLPYGAGGGALFATEDHLYYLSFGNRNPDVVEAIGKDACRS